MKGKLIGYVFMTLILVACGSAAKETKGDLNDKKAELQKLKTDQKKLNEQIAKLEADIKKADPAAAAAANAKLVAVQPVGAQDFAHFIELQGRVDAENVGYVAPRNGQGGIVTAVYVREGQNVRKGQVLLRLDDALIRQQAAPLQAQLNAARDTYRRTKNLWDQGIGTYQQVLTAQTQVETLERQIGIIQQQAGQMTITAPMSGVADIVNIKVGELFVGATATGPQVRIINNNILKVVVAVPENYLTRVNVGSKLQITLPEQNNQVIEATVSLVGKVINPNTRTFDVEARIPSSANLKPNQMAQVKILDYAANNAITIPLNTVQTDDKGKYVFIAVNEGGKTLARRRTITTGQFSGDRIEVKSGLSGGEQLITEGYQNLYEGQVVSITK
jgi:membrane fusion protein, multidrug efflux system